MKIPTFHGNNIDIPIRKSAFTSRGVHDATAGPKTRNQNTVGWLDLKQEFKTYY